MIDPWLLLLSLLATYRLTRLIVKDTLLNELRWWILRRWPSPLTEFPYSVVLTEVQGAAMTMGTLEGGLDVFKSSRVDDDGDPLWLPVKTYKLTELLECPFCASVWISFAVMAVNPWHGWTFYLLSSLAVAGGVALIFARLDTE